MRAVHHHQRGTGENFAAAGEARVGDGARGPIAGAGRREQPQALDAGERERGVVGQEGSRVTELDFQGLRRAGRHAENAASPPGHELRSELRVEPEHLGLPGSGPLPDHPLRRARHASQHERHAGLDDARLLPGDARNLVAEARGMLPLDGRDAGHRGPDHIGGIEPAPQPRFEDRAIDARFAKEQQGRGAQHVEEARRQFRRLLRQPLHLRADPLDGAVEQRVGDRPAIEPESLRPLFQVRRGVSAGANAQLLKCGFDQERGGALALGSRDVHAAKLSMRVAQTPEQFLHGGQAAPLARAPPACFGPDQALDVRGGGGAHFPRSRLSRERIPPQGCPFAGRWR